MQYKGGSWCCVVEAVWTSHEEATPISPETIGHVQAVRTEAKKKTKKKRVQLEGQRFLGCAFPWCTAPRQLRRPVNTPVTDVIMALLRYRTTRSFCWTKTGLSPRWRADPDTTPAGSDVTFIWADVQLTFEVPWGGGLAGGWHREPCSTWRTVEARWVQ